MTKEEHLEWAKLRALYYCDFGDPAQAVASMTSDMAKHPDIALPHGVIAGPLADALMAASRGNRAAVRDWILGWKLLA
jgi:hypothetical protein